MFRIGQGEDLHRLVEGRDLIIGGVKIPYEKGLLGHSDADVLLHALTDALLGALALGNIGSFFPDTDPRFKGADSKMFLVEAYKLVKENGYRINNIDSTVTAQRPKLMPYIDEIRKNISQDLEIEINRVSVKAKTNETLGYLGRGEGIYAQTVVLLEQSNR